MNIDSPAVIETTNMPSGKKLSLVDIKDVILIPHADPDGVIKSAMVLKPGAKIVQLESIIPGTLNGTVAETLIEGATFWVVNVEFAIGRVSPSRMRLSKYGARRRFIGIYEDANGLQWLVGLKGVQGKLNMPEATSGQNVVEDMNQCKYVFTATLPTPLYFYDANDGSIFDPTFTQEFL